MQLMPSILEKKTLDSKYERTQNLEQLPSRLFPTTTVSYRTQLTHSTQIVADKSFFKKVNKLAELESVRSFQFMHIFPLIHLLIH